MTASKAGRPPDRDDVPALSGDAGQRLDKWLWFVRAIKSRTQAAALVTGGKVRLNSQRIDKPSQSVRPGDVVTLTVRGHVRVLKVLAPGHRRGPPIEARTLYEDLTPPPVPASAGAGPTSGVRDAGQGRPTKRERRQLDRLRDEN